MLRINITGGEIRVEVASLGEDRRSPVSKQLNCIVSLAIHVQSSKPPVYKQAVGKNKTG